MSQKTNSKNLYINKCIINMESNNELKEIHIKNGTCCCINNIITFDDIAIDENHTKSF